MDPRRLNCIHLFNKQCTSNLRNLTEANIQRIVEEGLGTVEEFDTTMKICSICRPKLNRYTKPPSDNESSSSAEEVISIINLEVPSQESLVSAPSAESVSSNTPDFAQMVNIGIFNKGMSAILTSPIDPTKIHSHIYNKNKCDEIYRNVRKNIFALKTEK